MKDPNILYDFIWTKDELDPYREMYDRWEGELMSPEVNRGDRHVWIIDDTYPDPDKIVNAYLEHLPQLPAYEFIKCMQFGYSVDNKLSKYYVGQEFGWHCDESTTWKNPKNGSWRRIISSITYLNDDYDGGETEFMNGVIVPESGRTLIFPSSYMYPHRGCPVTDGVKKIMVMHFWI